MPFRREEARSIFMETRGRTNFESPIEEEAFEWKYFGIYAACPEWFHLAISNNKVIGYLAGTPETLPTHFKLNPYLHLFKSEIQERFPAHLHINLSSVARGSGVGSELVARFKSQLLARAPDATSPPAIKGIHIVTDVRNRNVSFYLKNQFVEIKQEPWRGTSLLLMGCPLS